MDTTKKIKECVYVEKWVVDDKNYKIESEKTACSDRNSFLKCKQLLCRVSAWSALNVNIII
jgi:hypothetical protein